MNTLAFILACLLACNVINQSFGFQMGSRGLSELDMTRSQLDVDAGNDNKLKTGQLKTNEELVKRNKLLKAFTNKEYLFDDLVDPEPTVINAKTEQISADSVDQEQPQKLKREQRTNPYDNLFGSDFGKIALDLMKLSEDAKKPSKSEKKHKDENTLSFLMNEILNSEDRMKTKDMMVEGAKIEENTLIPLPSSDNSDQVDYNYDDLDYLSDEQLQNLYESYLKKPVGDAESEKSALYDSEKPVLKPVIHYKESLISSDIFNDKDLNEKSDLYFKTVSAQPYVTNFPNNAKQAKYNYNDPANTHNLDLINQHKLDHMNNQRDYLFISVITGCTVAVLLALLAGGVCVYTLKRSKHTGFETKTGLFNAGTTGISKSGSIKSNSSSSSGDRRLAQSAQMFHYQHQKQQMLAMEIANKGDKPDPAESSEGENDDADFTVYECPGLAPTGEMEVKNPLFKEDFVSSTNINASCQSLASMPPAYSTISAAKPESDKLPSAVEIVANLVQINETVVEMKAPAAGEKNKE